uniref:small monomeric GTPase n=1 Tax=Fundulus heteroclitus TaxID=8078 RepID=A0A3Q2P7Y8_FUNHE
MAMASNDARLHQPPPQKDAADLNFDYMFKLLIIGNSSVGKTSFLFRYADDSFTPAFVSTVGIDFKVKTVFRNNKRIKLQIWYNLLHNYSNIKAFNKVLSFRASQIKTYSWDNAQVILVGNKCDLEDERVIATEDGQRLSEELGFQFFEASAKSNTNVKQVFDCLVDIICDKMNETMEAETNLTANHRNRSLKDSSESHGACAC